MPTVSLRAVAAVLAGTTRSAALSAQQIDNPRSGQAAAAPAGVAQPVERIPRYENEDSASQTRERFREILRQYPPSLAEVLRLDPSLLTDERYLAPYPAVRGFLADHPEIPRNPSFFIGENRMNWSWNTPSAMRFQLIAGMFAGLAGLVGVIALLFVIAWVTRLAFPTTIGEKNRPPPTISERTMRRTDLSRALSRLKPRERALVWMAYAQGASHQEIAEILGLKRSSVKLLLFRARRRLARLLTGGAGESRT